MRDMFADLDNNKDSLSVSTVFVTSGISLLDRVTIDELQKHTELDTDRENDFTVEEVRVSNAHSTDVHRTLLDLDDSRR